MARFTDVTKQAGVADGRWSTGAAFADYDGDGFLDLMVTNYVDLDLQHLPAFGSAMTCRFMGINVQCGPRGLKGSGDSLFHNNGDGTFSDVSKKAGVDDPNGYFGLGVLWADFNNTGRPDIYVANDSTAGYLYRNEGNGKFTEIGMESGTALGEDGHEQAGMGVSTGDYLHTGRPSLVVTNFALDNTPVVSQWRQLGFSGSLLRRRCRVAFLALGKVGYRFCGPGQRWVVGPGDGEWARVSPGRSASVQCEIP